MEVILNLQQFQQLVEVEELVHPVHQLHRFLLKVEALVVEVLIMQIQLDLEMQVDIPQQKVMLVQQMGGEDKAVVVVVQQEALFQQILEVREHLIV